METAAVSGKSIRLDGKDCEEAGGGGGGGRGRWGARGGGGGGRGGGAGGLSTRRTHFFLLCYEALSVKFFTTHVR